MTMMLNNDPTATPGDRYIRVKVDIYVHRGLYIL